MRLDIQPSSSSAQSGYPAWVLISLVALTSLASETQKGAIVFREEVTSLIATASQKDFVRSRDGRI